MKLRYPFVGAFISFALIAAYLGLSTIQIPEINDKILHFIAFFLLTMTFYWIPDTSRQRAIQLTVSLITICLGFGSEALQWLLTTRAFDPLDIVSNLLGSLSALSLCSLYHERMLDRKRRHKSGLLSSLDVEQDLELALPPVESSEQVQILTEVSGRYGN